MPLNTSAMLSMLVLAVLCLAQVASSVHTMAGEGTLVDDEDSASETAYFEVEFDSSRSCEEEWFKFSISNQINLSQRIRQQIAQAIENQCGCGFISTFISNDGVTCDGPQPSIRYRGIISSLHIEGHNSFEFIQLVRHWAASGGTLHISENNLSLSPYNVITINDLIDSGSGIDEIPTSEVVKETPAPTGCIPNVDGALCLDDAISGSQRVSLSLTILLISAVAVFALLFQ